MSKKMPLNSKHFLLALASKLPSFKLRKIALEFCGIKIGNNSKIAHSAHINQKAVLGNNVVIGPNTIIGKSIIGDNSIIEFGSIFLSNDEPIKIGRDCYIGIYAVLEGIGGLVIGNNVHLAGPSIGIWTHSSINQCLLGDKLSDFSHRIVGAIKIEDNVWIGGKATIYPNVTIGHHSVILPNSVVNKNIPPYSMAGGVPAKIIRKIDISKEKIFFNLVDFK